MLALVRVKAAVGVSLTAYLISGRVNLRDGWCQIVDVINMCSYGPRVHVCHILYRLKR